MKGPGDEQGSAKEEGLQTWAATCAKVWGGVRGRKWGGHTRLSVIWNGRCQKEGATFLQSYCVWFTYAC